MLQAAEALQEAGLDKRRIKFELFASPHTQGKRRAPTETVAKQQDHCEALIVVDGRTRTLTLPKGSRSVLDAGLAEGLELPYACKGGVCSTCRALLTEGEVEMDANFALEDYEIARGYILTCQSYPVSDRIVVDYDQ